jgi:hypothetical protein
LCQDIYNLREDQIPGLLAIISNYQKAVSYFLPYIHTLIHSYTRNLVTHHTTCYFFYFSFQYKSVKML